MVSKSKYTEPPEILEPISFGVEWLAWWNGIQPEWRRVEGEGKLPRTLSSSSDSITSLRQGGPTGLLNLLLSLKWWGSLGADEGQKELWALAVNDLAACFTELSQAGSKRCGDELAGRTQKRRKVGSGKARK
jgi:hypothetical protein